MAAEDGLELPVGVTEKQFMQQLARMESRLVKMEGDQKSRFQNSNKAVSRSFQQLDQSVSGSLKAMAASAASTSKAFIAAFAGAAITAAFAGLAGRIAATIKGIAQLGDEAKRAGVEVEAFQQWGYVARQNRIDIGALTDGFKELNLRADEFVVTGKGSAAEAFQRLGYTANDLKQKLQDPSNLMLEIIGRLEGLDKAAQIRIADEIFGGTGGERFVELLGQGEAGIRNVMEEAKVAGVVIDAELVKRADELDKRFAAIQERLAGPLKAAAITAFEGIFGQGGAGQLSDLMHDLERAKAVLGGDLSEALIKSGSLVTENAGKIAELNQRTWELTNTADELAQAYFDLADAAFDLGDADTAKALVDAGVAMDALVAKFQRGEIDVNQLASGLMDVRARADEAVGAISDADTLSMSSIIGEVNALEGAMASAAGIAQRLWSWLAGIAGVAGATDGGAGLSRNPFDVGGEPMTTSPRPQRPGVDSYGDWVDAGTSKGGGGKGGGRGNNRLDALIQDLKTEEEILTEWYENSLLLLEEANAKELEAIGGYHEAKERLEQEHQERMARIKEVANQWSLQAALGAGADVLGAMGAFNKKALKMSQAFAAAEALVSTYKGAAKELEKGTFGFASAAAVIAKGLAFVAAIRSTSEGGGGGGSAGGGAAVAPPPPIQRIDVAWNGPAESMPGMQAILDLLNDAAARGLRVDARLVSP